MRAMLQRHAVVQPAADLASGLPPPSPSAAQIGPLETRRVPDQALAAFTLCVLEGDPRLLEDFRLRNPPSYSLRIRPRLIARPAAPRASSALRHLVTRPFGVDSLAAFFFFFWVLRTPLLEIRARVTCAGRCRATKDQGGPGSRDALQRPETATAASGGAPHRRSNVDGGYQLLRPSACGRFAARKAALRVDMSRNDGSSEDADCCPSSAADRGRMAQQPSNPALLVLISLHKRGSLFGRGARTASM